MVILRAAADTVQDFVKSILFFPVWWYSAGISKVITYLVTEVRSLAQSFRLTVLFRYLFKPMYGQMDIWGRVLSVPVRIGHFFVLTFITALYTLALSLLVVVWVVLPPIVVLGILYHLEVF